MVEGEDIIYQEEVASAKTEAVFLVLTIFFGWLFSVRLHVGRRDKLAGLFLFLAGLFLFYTVNYRTLLIQLAPASLLLKFGIFKMTVPLDNVESCRLDEIPVIKRVGGAGIHFMFVRQRYRASFNFLEFPRLVLAFKRKKGPLQEVSFSTRQPDILLGHLQDALAAIPNL